MKPRLCCIEPSGALRLVLIEIARKAGWDIEACKNLAEAQDVFAQQNKRLDLVVTTATLETGSYREVVQCLRSRRDTATTPIALFTGNSDEEQIELAMENGITEVFLKKIGRAHV
jgi:DNA-binding response OmpR family regulator